MIISNGTRKPGISNHGNVDMSPLPGSAKILLNGPGDDKNSQRHGRNQVGQPEYVPGP
jgi:hypothetical protein